MLAQRRIADTATMISPFQYFPGGRSRDAELHCPADKQRVGAFPTLGRLMPMQHMSPHNNATGRS